MKKALSILLYGLLAISLVVLILVFTLSEEAGVGVALTWTYILIGIAILASLAFPIVNLVKNPKAAKRSLIGIGICVVVVGIAFAIASSEPVTLSDMTTYNNASGLKLADACLYTIYIVMFAALALTIFGEIRNSIKNK